MPHYAPVMPDEIERRRKERERLRRFNVPLTSDPFDLSRLGLPAAGGRQLAEPYRGPLGLEFFDLPQDAGAELPPEFEAIRRAITEDIARGTGGEAPAATGPEEPPYETPLSSEGRTAVDMPPPARSSPGPSPMLQAEGRDREANRLAMIRRGLEGAANLDLPTFPWTKSGQWVDVRSNRPPVLAEGLRRREEMVRDRILPSEADALSEQLGFRVPEGTTWERLRQILPHVTQAVVTREAARERRAAREDAGERFERTMGFREEEAERRGEERAKDRAFRREKFSWERDKAEKSARIQDRAVKVRETYVTTLEPSEGKQMEATLAALYQAERADQLYERVAEKLGPVRSRVQGAWRRLVGSGDREFQEFDTALSMLFNQHRISTTGLAAPMGEIQMLKDQLGRNYDSPETFHARIDEYRKDIALKLKAMVEVNEQRGKKIPPVAREAVRDILADEGLDISEQAPNGAGAAEPIPPIQPPAAPAAPSGKVRMTDSKGKSWLVPREGVERARAAGWREE